MEVNNHFSLLSSVRMCCQMLSLMEAQALFFQQGYQSLTELENYRKQLKDEVRCDLSPVDIYANCLSARTGRKVKVWVIDKGSRGCLEVEIVVTLK